MNGYWGKTNNGSRWPPDRGSNMATIGLFHFHSNFKTWIFNVWFQSPCTVVHFFSSCTLNAHSSPQSSKVNGQKQSVNCTGHSTSHKTCEYHLQGLFVPFACVGSGDPVRVLRLLHNEWSIYCWDICTTCRYRIYVLCAQAFGLWDFLLLIHTLL